MVAALERLTSDLHGLIFDVQDSRTAESEARNAIEGRRIAAALDRLFGA
jgi:hypothetical protein